MRIADIEPITALIGHRNQLLVKVTADDGTIGWGESGLSGREKAVSGAVEHFKGFLVGQDCRRIGRIWQECYRSQYFEGGRVLTAALSAIDIALHDIVGKILGVPVYQLIGGKQRELVPTFPSAEMSCGPGVIEELQKLAEFGWTALRVFCVGQTEPERFDPRASISETADWVIKARQALGSNITLGIDYHHRLSVAEAASFCQRLPAGTLDFLEEPIRAESPDAYAALRRMTDIPFAIGEEFSSKWTALPYLERDLTQFLRLDVCNIGGFTEAMKVAGWAEAHYVDLMPHNPLGPVCTAASVHLCAAVPNMAWLETRDTPLNPRASHDRQIFPKQPAFEGPFLVVSDEPGLGIEVNEAALRAATPNYQEPPHLNRPDGSITNR